MIVEIITTGTELLLGEIQNTNSKYLAELLNKYGYTVAYMTTVGDNLVRMKQAIATALARADIVITTGGLGSTDGDITKKAAADAIGGSLKINLREASRLQTYYIHKGLAWNVSREKQAYFLRGADLLPNDCGVASGSAYVDGNKVLVHLPGPPSEVRDMAQRQMIPWLIEKFGNQGINVSKILTVEGCSEGDIEIALKDLIQNQSNPTIALLVRAGYTIVRITAHGETRDEALKLIQPIGSAVCGRISVNSAPMNEDPVPQLFSLLKAYGFTLSAAESCTGGWIGKLLTDLPGSSNYFKGSAVTYWNETKERILNVQQADLEKYTAVSFAVAAQMAKGSRFLYNSDIALSTTGYAGPGPGERNESPGLVYIGVSGPYGTAVYKERFYGNRECIRLAASRKALFRICDYIKFNKAKSLF